jgi:hypothetical protein
MKGFSFPFGFMLRNGAGLLALLLVHLIADHFHMAQRPGLTKGTPYLFLVLLYGWLVFHNKVLFEGMFLKGKRKLYAGWLFLVMSLSSFNMHFILHTYFGVRHTVSHIISFWLYTFAGLGIYLVWKALNQEKTVQGFVPAAPDPIHMPETTGVFSCIVDGETCTIPTPDIQYLESLQNYLKVITARKVYVTRLTLKEAEARLPKRQFLRISRSYIVNVARIDSMEPDAMTVNGKALRIGKVYKRYVEEQTAEV